jgi:hypothetical protein
MRSEKDFNAIESAKCIRMNRKPLETAVLFLTFNRLDATKQVFQAIYKARPPRLYIASDGPRDTHPNEREKVQVVRDYVLEAIDWDCDVRTLFREKNLGCKSAVENAITWFFEHEKMGIILEDDCLPSYSFFLYCQELLEKYENDNRIMMISGFNKQGQWRIGREDYFFSNLGGIWGWASWARSWSLYDPEMSLLDMVLQYRYLRGLLGEKLGRLRERQILRVRNQSIDTWDFAWALSRHINSGLACVPSKNLVTNIGFGESATHTSGNKTFVDSSYELDFPLKMNNILIADQEYDELFFNDTLDVKVAKALMTFKRAWQ